MAPKPADSKKKKPTDEPEEEPQAKKSGGSRAGAGRKGKGPVLGPAIATGTQFSITSMLGARAPPKESAPAGAPAAAPAAGPPVPALPPAPAFKSGEELGTKWHELIGTGDHEHDEALVEQTLKENPLFLRRVIATIGDKEDEIFFGPAKELC